MTPQEIAELETSRDAAQAWLNGWRAIPGKNGFSGGQMDAEWRSYCDQKSQAECALAPVYRDRFIASLPAVTWYYSPDELMQMQEFVGRMRAGLVTEWGVVRTTADLQRSVDKNRGIEISWFAWSETISDGGKDAVIRLEREARAIEIVLAILAGTLPNLTDI